MLYNTPNPHGGDVYGSPIGLDYSANTNPFGTPPQVLRAAEQSLLHCDRYPDPYCRKLVRAIGESQQVPEDHILCGSGAAELIYAYGKALAPETAGELAPTFSEYTACLGECEIFRYPLDPDREFAVGRELFAWLEEKKPRVFYLCNPNNPTGRLMEPALMEELLTVCRENRIRLFADECFLDLTAHGQSFARWLDRYPELFILRAFTKSYGMAGLRLGYGLSGDRELLAAMSRQVPPWNVSTPAQAAGIAALQQKEFLEKTRELLEQERPRLREKLQQLGLRVYPSQVNFLLFAGPEGLDRALRSRGIAIRNCAGFPGLGPGWYRIAVRLREQNEVLLRELARALERK